MHQPVSLSEEPQIRTDRPSHSKRRFENHLIKTEELIYIQACGDYVMSYSFGGISEGTDYEVF